MNKPKVILLSFILNLIILSSSFSEIVKQIQITGNTRISDETVLMFSKINVGQNFESSMLNKILKNLYDSNYFSDVTVKFENNIIKKKQMIKMGDRRRHDILINYSNVIPYYTNDKLRRFEKWK